MTMRHFAVMIQMLDYLRIIMLHKQTQIYFLILNKLGTGIFKLLSSKVQKSPILMYFEVKAIVRDTHLGGVDFDNPTMNHFVQVQKETQLILWLLTLNLFHPLSNVF